MDNLGVFVFVSAATLVAGAVSALFLPIAAPVALGSAAVGSIALGVAGVALNTTFKAAVTVYDFVKSEREYRLARKSYDQVTEGLIKTNKENDQYWEPKNNNDLEKGSGMSTVKLGIHEPGRIERAQNFLSDLIKPVSGIKLSDASAKVAPVIVETPSTPEAALEVDLSEAMNQGPR